MMLVHRDRIEPQLLSVFQLVEVAVVEPVALHRVEIRVRQVDPYRAVVAPCLQVEVGVRHKMKQRHVHGPVPPANRKTISQNTSGFSACGRWPQRGTISTLAPSMSFWSSRAYATGRMRSFSPH